MKLTMLRKAASHVIETMSNDFMVRDIAEPEQFKLFNNFQKLRYHGLVTPVLDSNKRRMKGRWLITRNGWDFLRGNRSLPDWVLVKENRITEKSEHLIAISEVSRDFEIATHFEYFDENNNPVGLRPNAAPSQVALL